MSPGHVPGRRGARACVALAILGALVLAPVTPAAASSPDEFSAADQYVETLPTSRGPNATKDAKRGRAPLPTGIVAKLRGEGGADAPALQAIATDSEYGAPQADRRDADKKKRGGRSSSSAVPSASVEAVRNGGGDMLWLLLALLAITGLMVGAVAYQRHRNSNSG
jgi:hypothetical protein